MPLELKNAGVTYQRAMNTTFQHMLHDCLQDYVDEIVVKSKEIYNHVNDLSKAFVRYAI